VCTVVNASPMATVKTQTDKFKKIQTTHSIDTNVAGGGGGLVTNDARTFAAGLYPCDLCPCVLPVSLPDPKQPLSPAGCRHIYSAALQLLLEWPGYAVRK
jgi:hypothetical protein